MSLIKLSANSGFKGSNMSRTVDEIFASWLSDNGKEVIEGNIDIDEVVGEAVSEYVTENLSLDDYDVKEIIETQVSDAVSNAEIEDKVVELLKDEIANGTFNEDITSGIQDAVVLNIDEKLEQFKRGYLIAIDCIRQHDSAMNELRREIEQLKSVTYRTWGEWFNSLMGWD